MKQKRILHRKLCLKFLQYFTAFYYVWYLGGHMSIGGTKWSYNCIVFKKFVFINIEIHDKAISENLRHLLKHVEIAVNFIHPVV